MATMSDDEYERYIVEHDVLVNTLQLDGYASIGCWPCTEPSTDGRAGRWAGTRQDRVRAAPVSAAFEAPYPVNLDLSGRRVLVVGGGQVAARKVAGLLQCRGRGHGRRTRRGRRDRRGSRRAVAPAPVPARRGRLVPAGDHRHRRPAVNRQVARDGEAANVLVNAADDPANCSFILPAVVRRGDLQLTVSTNGRSPAFASWARRRLEQTFTDTHARTARPAQRGARRGARGARHHRAAGLGRTRSTTN